MSNPKTSRVRPGELPGRPDLELESLRAVGHRAVDWMVDYLAQLEDESPSARPILPPDAPHEVFERFREALPEDGSSPDRVLDEFVERIVPLTTTLQHPGNLGYIPNSASIVGILGDLLASTLNQNVSIVRGGPSAAAVERQVVGWLQELLGLPASGGGILTSGGSLGNLMGLALAREHAGRGARDLRFYVSRETHSSIERAVKFLGLPRESMIYVELDDELRIRPDALEEAIASDRASGASPAAVVAAAGTIGNGAVDDLEALGDVCERHGLWLHVDGAYGALAAAAPSCAWMRPGLARADSLSLDPHKWLFVPIDVSCLLVRDLPFMRRFFGVHAEYLKVVSAEAAGDVHQPMEHTVELSRRFRALKLWMVVKAFGAGSLRALIEEHLVLAKRFASWVERDDAFELSAPVVTSTVCFRYRPSGVAESEHDELDRINEALLHALNRRPGLFISRNRIRGRFTLRACVTSLRTGEADLKRLWDACRELGPTVR